MLHFIITFFNFKILHINIFISLWYYRGESMADTILVVDDEEDILDLIEYTLTKEGYEVIACKDTKNVLDILDEEDISLILMDSLIGYNGELSEAFGIERYKILNRAGLRVFPLPYSYWQTNRDLLLQSLRKFFEKQKKQ